MNIAIILAAGQGTRLGCKTPKQFIKIKNKSLYLYCLETFNSVKNINEIIIVTNKEKINFVKREIKSLGYNNCSVIVGGNTRQQSVLNALDYINENIKDKNNTLVLIHDSVRPLIDKKIIQKHIQLSKTYEAIITGIASKDSVAIKDKDVVSSYLRREDVLIVQTPQSFNFSTIYNTYKQDFSNCTDDASILKNNVRIGIVEGSSNNFKITDKNDLKIFESIIKSKK